MEARNCGCRDVRVFRSGGVRNCGSSGVRDSGSLGPRLLIKRIVESAPSGVDVDAIHTQIAAAFPPAVA